MSLHHITWRATVGAVEDEKVVTEAVAWLVGDPDAVDIEQTTSYHGSDMYMVTGVSKKKQQSLASLARIGKKNLETLSNELDLRYDENNTLHFRLDFHSFINGEAVLAVPGKGASIKCHTKVEVYPGQNAIDECRKVLKLALSKVEDVSEPA
ncbi:MAG: hypothetical protein L7U62_00050 [Candidatus Poseidoniaceae archaeon]|nr:hypothetical protein [Candidatus Poseidoniaceae archaeon]